MILLSTDTRKSPFLHPYLSLPFSPTPSLFWGCASSPFNQLWFQPIHPSTTRNKKASQFLLFYEPSCSDCHKKIMLYLLLLHTATMSLQRKKLRSYKQILVFITLSVVIGSISLTHFSLLFPQKPNLTIYNYPQKIVLLLLSQTCLVTLPLLSVFPFFSIPNFYKLTHL